VRFTRFRRAAATIALTGTIIGIHAAPAEAVQANRVNRYLQGISVTASGPGLNCGRQASGSRYLLSVPRFTEKNVQMVAFNCSSGNKRVKFVHYYYSQWNDGYWSSSRHQLELWYNEAPGLLHICHAGYMQAPLFGPVTDTFAEWPNPMALLGTDFRVGCGDGWWNIHFEAKHSWSATLN
jgi:hypothetical protein